MTDSNPPSPRVLELADEFLDRYRRGERPPLGEYAARYPELAAEICEVFPAIAMMERIALADESIEGRRLPPGPSTRLGLSQLGDFRILREVGRGGMGVVFEAEQVSLGRHVALKVLPERLLADPKQRGRFEREAKAAARLHHTNIVPVFGVGEDEGTPYYAMQFIPGLGLDQVIKELKRQRGGDGSVKDKPAQARLPGDLTITLVARSLLEGRLGTKDREGTADEDATSLRDGSGPREPVAARSGDPTPISSSSGSFLDLGSGDGSRLDDSPRPTYWRGVARIGSQVADALAYAHSQGIVHRDIKPSNLLLDARGVVWVTDFGLAKVEDQEGLTHTGDILGTLRYMPPEAFEGRHDARGDVYSLGLSLYEMLAFRPAFDEADRGRLVRQVTAGEPPRLRSLNPEVPRDLETVVHKAIEREPSHRYATAALLAEDLRRYMDDRPIQARRASETEKLRRWCRRNPVPAALLATLFLVFWAGFGLVTWKWREAVAEREAKDTQRLKALAAERDAGLARDRAEGERRKALDAAERAGRTVYYGQIARARLEYQANNIAQAEASLELCDPSRRGWEWYFLKGLLRSELFKLEGHDGWLYQVAYSPDGRLIATSGGGNPFFTNSRDNSTIRPGQVILWDAATGRRFRAFTDATHLVTNVTFSPDSRTLASAGLDGKTRIYDVDDGRLLRTLDGGQVPNNIYQNTEPSVPLAFSPDGARLAIGQGDLTIALLDVATGGVVARLPASPYGYREAIFSPDGRWLATASANNIMGDSQPRVWDASTGAEAFRLESGQGCARLRFSPDSRMLVAVNDASTIMLWDLPGGKFRRVLSGHEAEPMALAFRPDGLQLALSGKDGQITLLDLAKGQVRRVIRGHTKAVASLAFSPDGFRLVSGSSDGTARVWDLTTDPEVADVNVRIYYQSIEAIAYDRGGGEFRSMNRDGIITQLESLSARPVGLDAIGLKPGWATPAELACFDAEGRRVVVVDLANRREVVCLDQGDGGSRVVLRGHDLPVRWVTLSADGSRAATAALTIPSADGGVRGQVIVWDASSGQPILRKTYTTDQPRRIALDPKGRFLAVSAVRNGIMYGKDRPDAVPFLAVFEVATGREILRQDPLAEESWALGFSPDGRRLAAACLNRKLYLWDMEHRRLDATSEQGAPEARDLAFSPDGRRLAMASRSLVEIANAETGEEVLILRGRSQQSTNERGFNPRVRFSPDGTRILAVCDDMFPALSEWSIQDDDPETRARLAEGRKRNLILEGMVSGRQMSKPFTLAFYAGQIKGLDLDVHQNIVLGQTLALIGRPDQADAAFRRADASNPARDRVPLEAAMTFADLGQWGLVGGWIARLEGRTPQEFIGFDQYDRWSKLAACRVMVGDRDGYRRLCRELAVTYKRASMPYLVLWLARTCVLADGALDDPGLVVRLAERARKGIEDSNREVDRIPQAIAILGMAHDRAGDPIRAEQLYREALDLRPDPLTVASCRAQLAIALWHQGRQREARASLDEANRWVPPASAEPEKVKPDETICPGGAVRSDDWWTMTLARREARALILDHEFPADPFAR